MKNHLIGLTVSLLLHGGLALALLLSGASLPAPPERTLPLTVAMFEAEPVPTPAPPAEPAIRAPEPRPVTKPAVRRPRPVTKAPKVVRKIEPSAPEIEPSPETALAEPDVTEPAPTQVEPAEAPEPEAESDVVLADPLPPMPVDEPPPVETAMPEPPPAPVSETVEREAVAHYAELLAARIARHRAYPRLAQLRRMQGMVEVRMRVGPGGRLLQTEISRSSGYEVLDRQALEMVRLANPLPEPPDALQDKEFTVSVPVAFRLESG